MRTPTRRNKPGKRTVKRSSGPAPAPSGEDGSERVVVELVREFLRRPTRTLLQLIARLAPLCLGIAALMILKGGSAGAPVALQLVDLLVLLVGLAAVDQWLVVPGLRGLGKLARIYAARRLRPESPPNAPPQARSNQPLDPPRPD
jgi:hypothetical protein